MRDLLLPVLQDYTLRFGRQLAASRILSRNFSHHMGSHIHPRTKSNVLNERLRHLLGPVSTKKEQMYEFVNWMRDKYSDYATARNEFVAAPFQSSKSVYFYHDLVLPFVENMLVMDNLAASEGVRYRDKFHNRLRIRFRYKGIEFKAVYRHSRTENIRRDLPPEVQQICYPDFFPYFVDLSHTTPHLNYEEFYADKTIENREDLPDLLVSVPHEHAFFSVLENLIRNIAKHQKRELNSIAGDHPVNMEITIDVNDDASFSEYYYVDLYDNISRVDNAEDWELFKEKINTELIDKVTLATANQNLGILDMRTCATILAGQKEAIDDGKGSNTPPLEVFLRQGGLLTGHKIRHDEYFNWRDARINYRFKIQKARRICYIGNTVQPNEKERKTWASEGVYFFKSPDDFLQQNEKSPVTYVFSIIEESELADLSDEKKLDKLLFNLPFKTLVNPSDTAKSELLRSPGFRRRVQFTVSPIRPGQEPVNTLQDQCWKAWLNRFDMLEKTTLIVHRERNSPEWAKAVENFNNSSPPFRMILDQPGQQSLDDFTLKTGNSYAMYDHHSEGIIPFISGGEKGRMQLISHQNSHLPYDITSHDFARIDSPRFPAHAGEPWVFPYKLLQAAMLRILIIDERFADYANKPASGKIGQQFPYRHGKEQVRMNLRNFDLCWASNVFIASHVDFYGAQQQLNGDIQYDPVSDHSLTIKFDGKQLESYTNFNRDEGKDRQIPYDFVIIHRTLLSERQWLNGETSMDFIKKIREHIPYVILESGGNNHIFNETVVNFISYSELSSYFNDKSVSKLSLVQRLTSLIT
ncbi:MAG: hypothetical protein IT260_06475 [Saprospiraceae bacterium]|nr:hypothetical protein [Saprospiraceae bacterium]